MNLAEPLERFAHLAPDKLAVVDTTSSHTYAAFDRWASKVAEALASLGVGRGDRVAVLLPSTAEHLAVFYGVEKLGAMMVGLHLQLVGEEIAYQVGNCTAKVVVTTPTLVERVLAVRARLPALEHVVVTGGGDEPGTISLAALVDGAPGEARAVAVGPEEAAVVYYTSGTTGVPKGVVHTHEALAVLLDALAERYSITSDDRHLIALPLFLLSILLQGPVLACHTGGTVWLMERYDAAHFGRLVRDERITFCGASIPTMYIDLAELPEAEARHVDLSSLRYAVCGGSPIPVELRRRFEERYDMRIVFGFGGTEGPGGITADPLEGERKVASVGITMDHIHLKIVDENDVEVPIGEIGEICTGPWKEGPDAGRYRPMKEYWGMPEASAEALRNGYLHWGDLGYVDEDGFVYIVDRKKDVIIRAGMNIYPAELEKVLYLDERVAECAIVGMAAEDHRLGEIPKAFVHLRSGATATKEELMEFVAERTAKYKHLVDLELVGPLPRNTMGKILKRELRDRGAAAAGG